MIKELERAHLIAEELVQQKVAVADHPQSPLQITVVDDEGVEQPSPVLPDHLPSWAMSLAVHSTTFQRTAVYRCDSCGGEHEEYRQNPRDLPYAKVCGCLLVAEDEKGSFQKCTAVALRRVTYPGEGVPLNARRFEEMVIYRYKGDMSALPSNRSKYWIPGRNQGESPDNPNFERVEITNIHDYNKVVKEVDKYEVAKMSDHREMHRLYWGARRKAMRDHVDSRIRHNATLVSLARIIRKISDAKTDKRYAGKNLDSRFHGQLIEFNQGNMQDYCDADTGWKSRRAK